MDTLVCIFTCAILVTRIVLDHEKFLFRLLQCYNSYTELLILLYFIFLAMYITIIYIFEGQTRGSYLAYKAITFPV